MRSEILPKKGLSMAKFPNKMYVLEKFGWEFQFLKKNILQKNSKNMGVFGTCREYSFSFLPVVSR